MQVSNRAISFGDHSSEGHFWGLTEGVVDSEGAYQLVEGREPESVVFLSTVPVLLGSLCTCVSLRPCVGEWEAEVHLLDHAQVVVKTLVALL